MVCAAVGGFKGFVFLLRLSDSLMCLGFLGT